MDNYLELRKQQQAQAASDLQHRELVGVTELTGQKVLYATESLIKYLEGHVTKTEVINQLESVHTPDVDGVIKAIEVLDTTVKQRPQTDLSGVIELMQQLLEQAKQLPKQLPEFEQIKPFDYSKDFASLTEAVQAVERVVKEQELIAEAPVVNVPQTQVTVDAPNLTPLQKGLSDVQKAIKAIVIPQPEKLDTTALEKLLGDQTKTLEKILRKPISSGGGGGSSWVATGPNGFPAPIRVDASGALIAQQTTNRYDLQAPVYYIGQAPVGSAETDGTWIITKYDLTTNPYTGKVASSLAWADRAGGTYY